MNSVQANDPFDADPDASQGADIENAPPTGIQSVESTEPSAEKNRVELDNLDPLHRLEAVLFLAKEPLNSRKLSQLAGLQDGTRARSLVKQLNHQYDQVGRAFIAKQVAGGFQMRTRPMFSDWLKKSQSSPATVRLTSPVMETLSVIAYRQPVLKAEIEAIRGVGCGELLRQLQDRGLVKISGRSDDLGNPFLYGTTRRFLEVFGLASIDDLPRGKKLRGKGLPAWSFPNNDEDRIIQEKPGKPDPNPLDEGGSNSQNIVELSDSTNRLHQEDHQEE